MIILADSREQLAYEFTGYPDVTIETAALSTGDYSLKGCEDRFALERKSLNDLIGCLMDGRERFEKELARARHLEVFHVVVETSLADVAAGRYTSQMNPHSALQSILAFTIRYKTSFIWAGSRRGGEYVTYHLLAKYLYELEKRFKAAVNAQGERRQGSGTQPGRVS